MLEVSGLHTFYGNIEALRGVDVRVAQGQIVSLIGANGAGKSTLLMTICGNPHAARGRVRFEGQDITGRETYEIVRLGIAQAPEGRRIFPRMTVQENLIMGAYHKEALRFREESLAVVYSLFPLLKERGKQRAGTLSGGEQQMLTIARGLMSKPKLMMLVNRARHFDRC